MVDGIAHRYGLLPSEVLAKASTQDLYIYDTVLSYKSYLEEKENNKGVAPQGEELAKQVEAWRSSRGQSK